jgi:hypothetical protein
MHPIEFLWKDEPTGFGKVSPPNPYMNALRKRWGPKVANVFLLLPMAWGNLQCYGARSLYPFGPTQLFSVN